jgi:hypothetical protein
MHGQQCDTAFPGSARFFPACGTPMTQGPKPRVSIPVDITKRTENYAGRLWVLNLRLREGINQAAHEWEEGWREESLLVHRGIRPENTEKLTKQSRFALNELGQAYTDACVALREKEKADEAQRSQCRRWIVALCTDKNLSLLRRLRTSVTNDVVAHWIKV